MGKGLTSNLIPAGREASSCRSSDAKRYDESHRACNGMLRQARNVNRLPARHVTTTEQDQTSLEPVFHRLKPCSPSLGEFQVSRVLWCLLL